MFFLPLVMFFYSSGDAHSVVLICFLAEFVGRVAAYCLDFVRHFCTPGKGSEIDLSGWCVLSFSVLVCCIALLILTFARTAAMDFSLLPYVLIVVFYLIFGWADTQVKCVVSTLASDDGRGGVIGQMVFLGFLSRFLGVLCSLRTL